MIAKYLCFLLKQKPPSWRGSCQINFYYISRTFTAFSPFRPSSRSNVTSSFSLTPSLRPVTCTKYSLEDLASLIKPNPLDSLKNFTIPLFIYYSIKINKNICDRSAFRKKAVKYLMPKNFCSFRIADNKPGKAIKSQTHQHFLKFSGR